MSDFDPAFNPAFDQIPALPGAYALHLRLASPCRITPGSLGERTFPAGEYIYLGSALGPGGLRARLGRHLTGAGRSDSRLRWHIDYLRRQAQVIAAGWALYDCEAQHPRLECLWSQTLAALPGASIPAPGFGAGDCRCGCAAHLVAFPTGAAPLGELISTVDGMDFWSDTL